MHHSLVNIQFIQSDARVIHLMRPSLSRVVNVGIRLLYNNKKKEPVKTRWPKEIKKKKSGKGRRWFMARLFESAGASKGKEKEKEAKRSPKKKKETRRNKRRRTKKNGKPTRAVRPPKGWKKTNKPVNQDREIKMLWNSRFFFGDFSGFLFFFASTATGEWFTVCNEYVATASRLSRLLLRPFSCFFFVLFFLFF